MMIKTTAAGLALGLALGAVSSSAQAAPTPRAKPYPTTFPVPASVLPGGIAPGTPRVDWDLCDGPHSLFLDSFYTVLDPKPLSVNFGTEQWTSIKALRYDYAYSSAAPANPYQTWPAYVTCTVYGPVTVPALDEPFRYSITMTDTSDQKVSVAYLDLANARSVDPGVDPQVNYRNVATAHWVTLAPGQSHVFSTPQLELVRAKYRYQPGYGIGVNTNSDAGYWLVRPSVPPFKIPNFTEWIYAFGPTGPPRPAFNPARPTGQCEASLVPGTVSGIASALNGGYWVLSSDGQVAACDAPAYGSFDDTATLVGHITVLQPYIVASTPHSEGYWLVQQTGLVLPFGPARYYGQFNGEEGVVVTGSGGQATSNPAPLPAFTGFAATPSGTGYWLVTAYGKVFAHHAPFFGSGNFKNVIKVVPTGYIIAPDAAIGIAPVAGGKGYVIVARDGVTERFGHGPVCHLRAGVTVAGIAPDYRTGGYWVASTNGRVYACQAPSYPYKAVAGTVAGIGALSNGLGYRLVTTNGKVWDFGAATFHGNPN